MTDQTDTPPPTALTDPAQSRATAGLSSDAQSTPASLSGSVMRGTAWIVAARFVMRVIGFVNTIIIAKLLLPEDFGVVAIGVAAMQLVQGLSNIGLSQAVVKFHDATDDDLNTLFTLSAIRAVLTAIILIISGYIIAQIYEDPRFVGVFFGVALTPLLLGLMNPRFYEFERQLDFSREFFAAVSDKIVSVIVSVSIALWLHSYWALIIGMLAGAATQMVISYAVRPFMPTLTLASFRRMINFSGWLAGVSFVVSINNKLDSFFLARFIGLPATGVYYLGNQLAGLITSELADPVARAIYPGLSKLQQDATRMRRAFLGGVGAIAAVALPAAFGVAFVAPDLVALVFGEKWAQIVPILQLLTPAYGVQALVLSMHYYAIARDRVKLVFYRELAFALIKIPLFVWAAMTHGFLGAVYMATATCLFYVLLQLILYWQVSGSSMWEPLWAARRSFGAIAVMALWFIGVRPTLDIIVQAPIILRLFIDVGVGMIIYLCVHYALWRVEGMPDGVEERVRKIVRTGFAKVLEARTP